MVPRRIGFYLKYVDSTLYTVFREILGFFLVFLSNWPSLYIIVCYSTFWYGSSYFYPHGAPPQKKIQEKNIKIR
jgi:hypothetical protein